ncbi:MAG: M23 family metallopeptidase [Gemmatimonadota bacterium]
MADRKWTILLVGDERTEVRQFQLSREMVRSGIALLLLSFSLFATLTTQILTRVNEPRQTHNLRRENSELKSQLGLVRGQVDELNGALAGLAEQDTKFRLLAGLEPLDAEVLQAGIGGPDSETLEHNPLWKVNRLAGERAFGASKQLSGLLRRANVLSTSWTEASDTLYSKHDRLARTPSILPTNGTITSTFTRMRMHPILHRARPHEGLDITAPHGTPIVAAAKGRVKTVSSNSEYGLMIEIDHGFGLVTRYAHASRILVKLGQEVLRGDPIGRVGATGLAVGPHLHYEVLQNGNPVNPGQYLMSMRAIPD